MRGEASRLRGLPALQNLAQAVQFGRIRNTEGDSCLKQDQIATDLILPAGIGQ
jgi:hypothetical protein